MRGMFALLLTNYNFMPTHTQMSEGCCAVWCVCVCFVGAHNALSDTTRHTDCAGVQTNDDMVPDATYVVRGVRDHYRTCGSSWVAFKHLR